MAAIQTGLLSTLVYRTYTDPSDLGNYLRNMGIAGLKDRIVGVYAVPTALITATNNKISNQTAKSTTLTITRPSTIDGYAPKNKKLLTYPYLYATVACGNKEQLYVFEKSYIDSVHTLSFNIYGVMGQGFKVYILPKSYDHLPFNFNCAFEDDYPQMPVAITPFIELLGNNGIVSKLLPLALTAAVAAIPAPTPLPVKSEVASTLLDASPVLNVSGSNSRQVIASGASDITQARMSMDYEQEKANAEAANAARRETLEKYHIASHTLPQITGTVNFNNISYMRGDNDTALAITMNDTQGSGSRIKGVWGMVHSIRARDAEAIDDFFTVYGYTCDKVKVPNTHVRTRFTYTKTQGCRIKPKVGGGGVAGYYMAKICSIFDSGITFWQKTATVGDYSGTNAILP